MVLTASLSLLATASAARAADDVVAGELRSYLNLHTIGVEWALVGDDDHDATATVRYRYAGGPTWRDAFPLVRVAAYGDNMLAGSILFLEPETSYEVELTLSDPDGGSATETLTLTTRGVPQRPSARTFHVEPGAGGGDGSAGAPFQGIAAAEAVAQAGDTFLVHAGTYSGEATFSVGGASGNYVAWVGAGDGVAAFPDSLRIGADHIWIEGLSVDTGPDWALRVNGAPDDIVISRCAFANTLNSIDLNHGGSNWYIVDNTIVGATDPASESFSGEGVELQNTDGHVVAFNSISYVADGISYPGTNCDLYGNDIFDASDDGIETDLGYANVRVWSNRLHNVGHNGFSFQPQQGAPWYFIRNQLAGFREDPIKFREGYDRFVFAHNTVVNYGDVFGVYAHGMVYAVSRNNLWISMTGGRMWTLGEAVDWRTDLDYDGFDWGADSTPFRYLGANLADLAALQSATGHEANAVEIDHTLCLPTLVMTAPPPTSVPAQHMTLASSGCAAVDSGEILPNLSDGYLGSAPDLGAYEVGADLPHYGPRPADDGAPTAPTDLVASADSDVAISLAWSAATDDVAVAGYRVFRDGVRVGTATGTSYQDVGLSAETSYSYTVSAYDAYWHVSPLSAPASATTLAAGQTVDAGVDESDAGTGGDDVGGGCCSGSRGRSSALFLVLVLALLRGWRRKPVAGEG